MRTSRTILLPAILVSVAVACGDSANPGLVGGTDGGPGTTPGADGSTVDSSTDGAVGPDGSTKPKFLTAPSHGSSVALSIDDSRAVMVNAEAGTVTVFAIDYAQDVLPTLTVLAEVAVGAEPTQAVIHPNGTTAYVVVRKEQKVVRIDDLLGTPHKGAEIAVGSEPTGIAMEPSGTNVYVTSWIDGTITGIATATMTAVSSIDLNATLAASGLLGPNLTARPSMSHPRSIAMTNNGDTIDADEALYVTEFYALQKTPVLPDGSNIDTAKVGVVYKIPLSTKVPSVIELPPMVDMGFHDLGDRVAGCFPNQLASIVIQGSFGYVSSTCASPRGALGLSAGPAFAACSTDATCPGAAVGSCASLKCTTNCTLDTQCGSGGTCPANVCALNPANVKSTNAPVVSIIDLGGAKTIATVNLAKEFHEYYNGKALPDDATRRVPLVTNDVGFVPGTVNAYFASTGSDAIFRVNFDATYVASTIESVADPKAPFINLTPAGIDTSRIGRMPTGIAVANKTHTAGSDTRFAFVANEATRNLQVVDLANQELAGLSNGTPVTAQSAAQPTDQTELDRLEGKRLFVTGLGRWSWKGQGWMSCVTCHADGLSDNVTWTSGRGPSQAPSLEGTFNSKDGSDYRVNMWRGSLDEFTDHEGAIRSFAGGIGAIVKDPSLNMSSRLDGVNQGGLNGSSLAVADPANPEGLPLPAVLTDWQKIGTWMKAVRSPRRPTTLDPAKVTQGHDLYVQGNCQGCHSGPKWTISRVFYAPDKTGTTNGKLTTTSWSAAATGAGFPAALFPAQTPALQMMRYAGPNKSLSDSITCMLRPVGTYNVAEPGVGISELKPDGVTPAGGNEPENTGYNIPSLLGMQTGAPYFHAGQARTLEAALGATFATHLRALSPGFLDAADPASADKLNALIQFLLSIDEDQPAIATPAVGPSGGDFCVSP